MISHRAVIKLNSLSVLIHIPHEEKIRWKRLNPRVGGNGQPEKRWGKEY
jgi:hypothetical protein